MTFTPLCLIYLRAVGRLNRRAEKAEQAKAVALFQRDDALELVADLRLDVEELQERCDGWQRRAEALAEALPPDLVEGVFAVIDMVERLDEVEAESNG